MEEKIESEKKLKISVKNIMKKHMKEETERLNKLVDWYRFKLNEISEAPVDSRPRKLRKLYRCNERNKDFGVTINQYGVLTPVNYPKYPPELEIIIFIYY